MTAGKTSCSFLSMSDEKLLPILAFSRRKMVLYSVNSFCDGKDSLQQTYYAYIDKTMLSKYFKSNIDLRFGLSFHAFDKADADTVHAFPQVVQHLHAQVQYGLRVRRFRLGTTIFGWRGSGE